MKKITELSNMSKANYYKATIQIILITASIAFPLSCLTSCNNEVASPAKPKMVKYEITGNFSGTLTVIYTSLTGGSRVDNNVVAGWIMEMEYPASTSSIGIGAQGSSLGSSGQTATIRIFVNETEVKSSSATAGSQGEIIIPTITHTF